MPLESCMILLDNSEYMRNGDYIPTRLEAQIDAANMLVGAKTQTHRENTVGVSAGTELLVSPTEDVAKILKAVHRVLPVSDDDEDDNDNHSHHGNRQGHFHSNMFVLQADAASTTTNNNNNIAASVQVANLALKHRKNKNGLQRIILFVGTPLTGVDSKTLIKAGKQLKKNNVMIDVVALGELEINEPKLQELVDAANGRSASTSNDATAGAGSDRTCHLVTVPPGTLPSDVLASSPILAADGGAYAAAVGAAAAGVYGGVDGGSGAAANPFADFGGVDPNMDPELAMALRVSMEEERARQERAAAAASTSSGGGGGGEESKDAEMTDAAGSGTAASAGAGEDALLDEEEALLQQALAMSMQENEPKSAAAESEEQQHDDDDDEDAKFVAAAMMETDEDDDAAMQMALQMSMQQEEETSMSEQNQQQQLQDPAFVQELLGSMPGVDPNDPEIQKALREAAAKKKQDDDKKKKKDQNK